MQLSNLVLMSLGELLLVTTVASVLMLVMAVVRKRRDRSAAGVLIANIKENEGTRDTQTRALLEKNFGLEGEPLEKLAGEIGRGEQRFYQFLINLYLQRDAGALKNLQGAFDVATEPYRNLGVPQEQERGEIVLSVAEPVVEGDSREIARLQEENERLLEELRITMDTMGRMLSEYSSVDNAGSGEEQCKGRVLEASSVDSQAKAIQESSGMAEWSAGVGEGKIATEGASAERQGVMPDRVDADLFAGSEAADLQSKMDGLGAEVAGTTGGGREPSTAADDDQMALNETLEMVPEQGLLNELEETELIDLDAVLEQNRA